jgi:uncharacterized protein with FMN-binding domain
MRDMSKHTPSTASSISQAIKKFALSGFVMVSFIAYFIHQRFTPTQSEPINPVTTPQVSTRPNTAVPTVNHQQPAAKPVISQPTPTPQSVGRYRDGVYDGGVADAYYGYVQVEVTIQNDQITDVAFLDYPHDRRTSAQINSIAMPYLKQEAIQAQSARVNIISGATLTSEAFAQSLQSALSQAKNQL